MQDIKQNLANAVREARTELGLSQEKLAEILNLDQRTILNIEAGRGARNFRLLLSRGVLASNRNIEIVENMEGLDDIVICVLLYRSAALEKCSTDKP